MGELSFEQLQGAVAGEAVALRSRVKLQPAGGRGTRCSLPLMRSRGTPITSTPSRNGTTAGRC